jgi:hypothetical protein
VANPERWGGSACEAIIVATMFELSWKPLRKSKIKAKAVKGRTDTGSSGMPARLFWRDLGLAI